jgi:hypothetical protein
VGIQTIKRKWSDNRARRSIHRILEDSVLCSMSTVTKENKAHINIAYFAYSQTPKLEVYYLSYPDSLHSKNLVLNSSMGMAIYGSKQDWGGHDRGMQMIGTCAECRGVLRRRAVMAYAGRFKKFAKWKKEFAQENGKFELRFYRFLPSVAMFLDEGVKEYGDALVIVQI